MQNDSLSKEKKARLQKMLVIIFTVIGVLLLGYFIIVNFIWKKRPPLQEATSSIVTDDISSTISSNSSSKVESIDDASPVYPTDKLFITKGRQSYQDAEMTLRVPRLDLVTPVLDGSEPEVLDRGVALYDYAQLPGPGNRNTSMTAHRNKEFDYIDTITTGDKLYLEFDGIEYTYEYESTKIIKPDDWTPLHCKEYPVLTLISCHPVNSSKNRIVITSRLVSQKELSSKEELVSSKTSKTSSKPTKVESTASTVIIKNESIPQSSAPTTPKKSVVLKPEASGVTEFTGGGGFIDASNVTKGYVMAKYNGTSQKSKLQITGPDNIKYTYSLTPDGEYETFALTAGNGSYSVNVYENIEGTKYALSLGETIDVQISNPLSPYLYPNQYVNFNANSSTVAKGEELAGGAKDDLAIVQNVYNYVTQTIKYDHNKASSVKSGYLPAVDSILSSGKGICFDYAAVFATMLRTQQIPTRLEVGYVSGNVYHAWVSVYLQNKGWVNGIIYFDGQNFKLMDPTFASSNNSSESIMQFIGTGSNYSTKYVY